MSSFSRQPLEQLSNRESSYSSQSSQKVSARQVTSTVTSTYMKRSMSGNNIYGHHMQVPPQRQNLEKDVAMFLLAVELERFLNENDKLKYRIKEMDDQLLDRGSYEKQIEDLQARLLQMQYQEQMYRQDFEMTSTTITTISTELESWKTKSINNDKELEALKYQRARDAEDFKAMQLQSNQQRANYENELQRQREQLQAKQIAIDNLNSELLQYQQQSKYYSKLEEKLKDNENRNAMLNQQLQAKQSTLEQFQSEINSYQSQLRYHAKQDEKLKDFENKITMLVCETERLNALLKQKLEDLESQKARFTSELDRQRSDFRVQYDKLKKDYDSLGNQNIMLQNELVRYKDQDQIIEQLQNKCELLTGEIERLNQVLRDKINQGEEWRGKFFASETQVNEYRQRLQKLDVLQMQLNSQIEKLNTMASSNDELKQKNAVLDNQNLEMKNRLAMISTEVERLNQILKQKVHELEDANKRNYNFENELKQKNLQYNDCKQKLQSLSQEIDRQQELYKQAKLELEEQKRISNTYQKELSNSEQLQQQFIRTIEEWKRKYSLLEQDELQSKNRRIQDFENKIALLTQEIERLNSVLGQKVQDFEEQRRQFYQETQKLKQQLALRSSENDELMAKFRRSEQELNQSQKSSSEIIKLCQMRIILHCAEVDRLSLVQGELVDENEQLSNQNQYYAQQNKQKDEQIYKAMDRNTMLQKLYDEEKSKRIQLEGQTSSLKSLQETCQTQEMKIQMFMEEVQRLTDLLRSKSCELGDLRSEKQRSDNMIAIMQPEIERLTQLLKKYSQDLEESRSLYAKLDAQYQMSLRQIDEMKSRLLSYETYKTKFIDLENRCAMLSTELERLQLLLQSKNEEIDTLNRKCYQYEQTIIQLRQYEDNVRILSNEIDRLQGIIDQQDNELRTWRLQYADGGALNKKIQDQLISYVMACAEIESLRARVQEKEREVEEVRRSSLAPYRR